MVNKNDIAAAQAAASDPYSQENVGVIQFIQLSRIYDVLAAILTDANPELARQVMAAHAKGQIISSGPYFEGVFLTDEEIDRISDDSDGPDASDDADNVTSE